MTSFEEFFSRFGPERHDGDQGRSSLSVLGRSLVQSWVARTAAVGVIAGVAALAVVLTAGQSQRVTAPAFIEQQLGAQAATNTVQHPTKDTRVVLGKASGFTLAVPALASPAVKQHLTIRSADTRGGSWQGRQAGAVRSTAFGNEAVVVTPKHTEQFLTVTSRHGLKTWRWQIDSSLGVPRVGDDGYVAFIKDHKVMQDLLIKPVEIYNAAGKNITPTGARWSLAQYGNSR